MTDVSLDPYLSQTVYDDENRLCIAETPDPSWNGQATRVWFDPETSEELASETVDAFPNAFAAENARVAALEQARLHAEALPEDDPSRGLILALLPPS